MSGDVKAIGIRINTSVVAGGAVATIGVRPPRKSKSRRLYGIDLAGCLRQIAGKKLCDSGAWSSARMSRAEKSETTAQPSLFDWATQQTVDSVKVVLVV
jgi:hypothetical protein